MPQKGESWENHGRQGRLNGKKEVKVNGEFVIHGEKMKVEDGAYQVFALPEAQRNADQCPLVETEDAEEVVTLLTDFLSRRLFTDRFVHPIQREFWKKLQLDPTERGMLKNNRINANALAIYTYIEDPFDLAANSLPSMPEGVTKAFEEFAAIAKEIREVAHRPLEPQALPLAEFAQFVGAKSEFEVIDAARMIEDFTLSGTEGASMVTFNKSGYDYLSTEQKVALVKKATASAIKILGLFGYQAQPISS